jgi:hypothetical protein
MPTFIIIENDDGLLVVEQPVDETAETAAEAHGGVVVDEGPYPDYDTAYDALLAMDDEEDDLRE